MISEYVYTILNWVIPSAITIIGIVLQSIISDHYSKKNLKRDYIFRIYDKRIEAYQEFYKELTKYRMIFENPASDIGKMNDYSLFDYTNEYHSIYKFFRENELYFDKDLIKKFKILMVNNHIKYEYLPIKFNEYSLSNDEIIEEARNTINVIDDCLLLIRKATGLEELDKAFK